jgi:hypothetical protein
MARGCVRAVVAGRDRTELALLLRSRGGGETGAEEVFPRRKEFPKDELLDTTALMLSSNILTSGGTGI